MLGAVSAVLILAGVLSPLDLPGLDLANFVGYVLWSLWLVVFGILLLRGRGAARKGPSLVDSGVADGTERPRPAA